MADVDPGRRVMMVNLIEEPIVVGPLRILGVYPTRYEALRVPCSHVTSVVVNSSISYNPEVFYPFQSDFWTLLLYHAEVELYVAWTADLAVINGNVIAHILNLYLNGTVKV